MPRRTVRMSEKSLKDKRAAMMHEKATMSTARGSVFNSAVKTKWGVPQRFTEETAKKFSTIFATKKLSAVARYAIKKPKTAPPPKGNARRTNQIA